MDVMLGYCFVHTCKGLVELGISLLGIDHGCHVGILLCAYISRAGRVSNILTKYCPWMSCWDIALCIHAKGW